MTHSYSDSQFHHVASTVMLAIATGKTFPTYSPAVVAGGTSLVSSAALSGRIGQTEIRAAAFAVIAAQAAHTIGHGGNNGGPLFKGDYARALAHGVSQGTIGWVQHKNFWQGFVSGSASHISGVYAGKYFPGGTATAHFARSAIAVTTAALLSKATGGDAMQSAMTAVIVHLFNYEGILGDDVTPEEREKINQRFSKPKVNTFDHKSYPKTTNCDHVKVCNLRMNEVDKHGVLDEYLVNEDLGQVGDAIGYIKWSKRLGPIGVFLKESGIMAFCVSANTGSCTTPQNYMVIPRRKVVERYIQKGK